MSRWLRLVVTAVVIAALVVALVLVRRGREQRAADEIAQNAQGFQSEQVTILNLARESITSITLERPDGTLRFAAGPDGFLVPEYAYRVSWSNSRINRIIGSAATLNAQRVISEEPDSLDQYGLSSPPIRVRVAAEGAEPATVLIGNPLPGSAGYYVQVGGNPAVYAVSSVWISPFLYSLDELRDKTLPQIQAETLESVDIRNLSGRQISIGLMPDGDNDPEMSLAPYVVTSPYLRRRAASTHWLDETLKVLPEVAITRYVDDDPADLSAYGLDPPRATLRIADGTSTLALEVGDQVEGSRYGRFPGGRSVFVITGTEAIVSTPAYKTISPFIYIVNIDLMESILVETNGERYLATLTTTPAEDPEDAPVQTFYFQGEEMEEDLFRDLYQWIIGLQVDAEAKNPSPGPPVMRITYSLNTGAPDVVVEIVPYDANYYAVYRDGNCEFVTSRNVITRLQQALADPQIIAEQ